MSKVACYLAYISKYIIHPFHSSSVCILMCIDSRTWTPD